MKVENDTDFEFLDIEIKYPDGDKLFAACKGSQLLEFS